MSLCLSVFCGRLAKDPEFRESANVRVANFTLAVDTWYKEKKRTSFFSLKAFGKEADNICKNARKGSKLIVRCEPNIESWTSADGRRVYKEYHYIQSWEFAESKKFLENKAQVQQTQPQQPQQNQQNEVDMPTENQPWMDMPDDEVPFV